MKIFLAYSRKDLKTVEPIALLLKEEGHEVFFDRQAISPGEAYNSKIRKAICVCEWFVFFVSLDSILKGSYSRSELSIADNARVKILPISLDSTQPSEAPASLQNISWFQSDGVLSVDLATHFATVLEDDKVQPAPRLRRKTLSRRSLLVAGATAGTLILTGGLILPRFWASSLIANASSGIVHHLEICADHLPAKENFRKPQADDEIHASLQVKIYETLALAESRDDEKVRLLLLGIQYDPCAIRIYDQLVRTFGRMKRYDSIHNTLLLAVQQIQRLESAASTDKEKKRLRRSIVALKIRQAAATKRAELSIMLK